MIDLLDRLSLWLSRALLLLGVLASLVMMIHVCADIIGKHFIGTPVPATLEIVSAYYMAAIGFCGLAYVQARGQHISIELLTERLHGRRLGVLMIGVHALTLAFLVLLAIASTKSAMHATRFGDAVMIVDWELPTWPSRWLVPLAASSMALVALAQLLRELRAASGPDGGDGET
jgi:TRAP-type C4-dicarboxylate transport system permease small subunit